MQQDSAGYEMPFSVIIWVVVYPALHKSRASGRNSQYFRLSFRELPWLLESSRLMGAENLQEMSTEKHGSGGVAGAEGGHKRRRRSCLQFSWL